MITLEIFSAYLINEIHSYFAYWMLDTVFIFGYLFSMYQVPARLSDFHPFDLSLPNHVCQILPGPNYDYRYSTMRFTISSPVVWTCCVIYLSHPL